MISTEIVVAVVASGAVTAVANAFVYRRGSAAVARRTELEAVRVGQDIMEAQIRVFGQRIASLEAEVREGAAEREVLVGKLDACRDRLGAFLDRFDDCG